MTHHHHHHHHLHAPARAGNRRRMELALMLNLLLLAGGVIGGVVFHSLALLADAGHVLSDVAAIGFGLAAAMVAARPAEGRRTFGLHRAETLAALANGLLLAAVSVVVIAAAVGRLEHPPRVTGLGVLVVGVVALAGNGAAAIVLLSGDRSDLNLEGVLRHSAADALGALGVVLSAAVLMVSGWRLADPVAGALIGVLVLIGSLALIRDACEILLETAPAGLDVAEVGGSMVQVSGVREVHDLHVWTVTSGFPALAAHVRTDPSADIDDVRAKIEALLAERFGIRHTTLQMMVERLIEIEDRRGDLPQGSRR
ncbi:MAG: cation diffusion facilitator family transporter [Thermoleophilaceae bacterium]